MYHFGLPQTAGVPHLFIVPDRWAGGGGAGGGGGLECSGAYAYVDVDVFACRCIPFAAALVHFGQCRNFFAKVPKRVADWFPRWSVKGVGPSGRRKGRCIGEFR